MTEIKLNVSRREIPTIGLADLKKQGKVPVELYGKAQKNEHLLIDSLQLQRVWEKSGSGSLIDLVINDEQPIKIIIHDIQHDPLKGVITHADFYMVSMNEELETEVSLVLVGESRAVKELGATTVQSLEKVDIACLPKDLVSFLEIDLSLLKEPGDTIRISDLKVPAGIRILNHPEDAVASAVLVKEEVVEAAPVDVSAIPVAGKEDKKEADEAKPGEGKGEKKEAKK